MASGFGLSGSAGRCFPVWIDFSEVCACPGAIPYATTTSPAAADPTEVCWRSVCGTQTIQSTAESSVTTIWSAYTTEKRWVQFHISRASSIGQTLSCLSAQFTRLNTIYRERRRQLAAGVDVLKTLKNRRSSLPPSCLDGPTQATQLILGPEFLLAPGLGSYRNVNYGSWCMVEGVLTALMT